MADKGKSKVVDEDKGKEVWDDDAAAAALGGWLDPGRRRDSSLFAGVLQEQVINSLTSSIYPESYTHILDHI